MNLQRKLEFRKKKKIIVPVVKRKKRISEQKFVIFAFSRFYIYLKIKKKKTEELLKRHCKA